MLSIAVYTDVSLLVVLCGIADAGVMLGLKLKLLFLLTGDIGSPEPELKARSTLTLASLCDSLLVGGAVDDMAC